MGLFKVAIVYISQNHVELQQEMELSFLFLWYGERLNVWFPACRETVNLKKRHAANQSQSQMKDKSFILWTRFRMTTLISEKWCLNFHCPKFRSRRVFQHNSLLMASFWLNKCAEVFVTKVSLTISTQNASDKKKVTVIENLCRKSLLPLDPHGPKHRRMTLHSDFYRLEDMFVALLNK